MYTPEAIQTLAIFYKYIYMHVYILNILIMIYNQVLESRFML
jgi:hypothetical protein